MILRGHVKEVLIFIMGLVAESCNTATGGTNDVFGLLPATMGDVPNQPK